MSLCLLYVLYSCSQDDCMSLLLLYVDVVVFCHCLSCMLLSSVVLLLYVSQCCLLYDVRIRGLYVCVDLVVVVGCSGLLIVVIIVVVLIVQVCGILSRLYDC